MKRQLIGRRYRIGTSLDSIDGQEQFLGFDQQMHRPVTIFVVSARTAAKKRELDKWAEIARATIPLHHRNLQAVYDVIRERDSLYVIQEYAPGETLRSIIDAEGPFHPDDVAILIEQLADAVVAIEQSGLKPPPLDPQQILVDDAGLVRMSPLVNIDINANPEPIDEVREEEKAGSVAPVVSLAVIAYEMLAGQLPEWSPGLAPLPPSEIRPDLSPAVDAVLQTALTDSSSFSSTQAFSGALSRWNEVLPPSRPASVVPLEIEPAAALMEEEGEALQSELGSPEAVEPSAEMPSTERSNLMTWIASIAVLATLIGLIAYGSQRLTEDDPTVTPVSAVSVSPTTSASTENVTVPGIVGMTHSESREALATVGLKLLVVGEPITSVTDRVETQNPVAGTETAGGSTVEVTFAPLSAPIDLAVMELTGKLATDARVELESTGLIVAETPQVSDADEQGVVLDFEPTGEVHAGDTISLIVGAGDKLEIPVSIHGNPLNEAVSHLESLGLTVETIGVSRSVIEDQEVNLEDAGIADQDVVGIQGDAGGFGDLVDHGAAVTLVYYDASIQDA